MTAVIGTLMREWVIPRMGVRHLRPTVFEGNPGSVRVFEKNGFVVTRTVKDAVEVKSMEASADEDAAAVVVGFLLQALAELEEALEVACAAAVAEAVLVTAAAVVEAFEVALQALEELEAVGVTRDKAPLVETH